MSFNDNFWRGLGNSKEKFTTEKIFSFYNSNSLLTRIVGVTSLKQQSGTNVDSDVDFLRYGNRFTAVIRDAAPPSPPQTEIGLFPYPSRRVVRSDCKRCLYAGGGVAVVSEIAFGPAGRAGLRALLSSDERVFRRLIIYARTLASGTRPVRLGRTHLCNELAALGMLNTLYGYYTRRSRRRAV